MCAFALYVAEEKCSRLVAKVLFAVDAKVRSLCPDLYEQVFFSGGPLTLFHWFSFGYQSGPVTLVAKPP